LPDGRAGGVVEVGGWPNAPGPRRGGPGKSHSG
jgi:hypothetical protein